MQIGPNDIIIYSILGLTIAMAANHYGNLDIPVLNSIQDVLIPGMDEELDDDSGGSYSYTPSSASMGCADAKAYGDAKIVLRGKISNARNKGDLELEKNLKERLAEIKEQQRTSCR